MHNFFESVIELIALYIICNVEMWRLNQINKILYAGQARKQTLSC